MSIDSAPTLAQRPKGVSVLATGLALFSMFFGAGNLVFPLLIGKSAGSETVSALVGLGVSAVAFPFLGLIAMMLYGGDLKAFLARLGKWPAFVLLFVLFMSQGPVGSMPRLITLMHASVKPYIPDLSLSLFSVLISGVIFWMAFKPHRIVHLLGMVLTPLLLATLAILIGVGIFHAQEPLVVTEGAFYHFKQGLKGGYQTLDLTAALLFASVIIPYLSRGICKKDVRETARLVRRRMIGASSVAAGLLLISYVGLSWLASHHIRSLPAGIEEVDLLYAIAVQVLGPSGSFLATGAVFLACLTTAISLASVFSEYLRKEWFREKTGLVVPLALTLSVTAAMATLGFAGIMRILGPALEILYPSLIVLCLLNIAYSLYQVRSIKVPVFTTLAIGSIGFFIR